MDRVSPADIQRVAKQFLFPDRLSMVLVGEASTIIAQLKAIGIENVERIAAADLDLSAPNLRKSARD